MKPLTITAQLQGAISMPDRPLALDALLAYAAALRDHIPPATRPDEVVSIEIPVKREPDGRFHLCSHATYTVEQAETRYQNRRPVIAEAQAMGKGIKRLQINAGLSKGYRIPYEAIHLEGDELRWWAIGDRAKIEDLLELISHLGKKRAAGLGRVARWHVAPCKPWGPGFPIMHVGRPMRPLPVDWPGLASDAALERCTITYPYPRTLNPDLYVCAVPWGAV